MRSCGGGAMGDGQPPLTAMAALPPPPPCIPRRQQVDGQQRERQLQAQGKRNVLRATRPPMPHRRQAKQRPQMVKTTSAVPRRRWRYCPTPGTNRRTPGRLGSARRRSAGVVAACRWGWWGGRIAHQATRRCAVWAQDAIPSTQAIGEHQPQVLPRQARAIPPGGTSGLSRSATARALRMVPRGRPGSAAHRALALKNQQALVVSTTQRSPQGSTSRGHLAGLAVGQNPPGGPAAAGRRLIRPEIGIPLAP